MLGVVNGTWEAGYYCTAIEDKYKVNFDCYTSNREVIVQLENSVL